MWPYSIFKPKGGSNLDLQHIGIASFYIINTKIFINSLYLKQLLKHVVSDNNCQNH
jgi:hypothetical protein